MSDPRPHIRALVEAVGPDAVVSVPAAWLREVLAGDSQQGRANVNNDKRLIDQADLTVKEVAARFGRKPCTVRLWLERGMFSGAYRLHGREWRIPLDALAKFEADARQGVPKHARAHIRARPRSAPHLSDWRKAS
jgi:excisionase family DNA binding protein